MSDTVCRFSLFEPTKALVHPLYHGSRVALALPPLGVRGGFPSSRSVDTDALL